MLKKLGVSTSGYYQYIKRIPCPQKQRKRKVTKEIKKIYEESKQIYGAPKITVELNKQGYGVSEKYVGNIMRKHNLKAHYIKPYTSTTKNCDFSSELHNILARDFNPKKPNAVWCSDITYVWTNEDGFVYLTSIMDLYSRKIISWTLSRSMETEVVLKCLEEAKEKRELDSPVVMHVDRGSQFTSQHYQELTKGMKRSYSKKGTPWDNACIESFHGIIKREWLNRYKIKTYEEAYRLIFEYLEGFYNTIRIHSHCEYESPNQYESKYKKMALAT